MTIDVSVDDSYTWIFGHKGHKHFVLYDNIEIIGYAHIQLWPKNRSAMRIIVIDEDKRQTGFGKSFMKKIEEWLKSKEIKSLHVESSPSALDFYATLGYTPMLFNDSDGYESGPNDIAVGKML